MAQIASGILGVPFDAVRVVHSDSSVVPRGAGTWGSRSLQVGGSAVVEQGQAVVAKARALASHLLEVDEADLTEPADGRFEVTGAPERAITWGELAVAANDPSRLPDGMTPGLVAAGSFRELESTFPFGAHVSVVEVDTQTGDVRPVRHVAVDDCGRILNPMLVDGQVHGGLGQGIAQALYEEFVYDETGNPVSGTLADVRDAGGLRAAAVRDRAHRDADAAEPAGRQGDRRVGRDRVDAGRPERGDGRALAPGRAPHRPAALARARVARDPRRYDVTGSPVVARRSIRSAARTFPGDAWSCCETARWRGFRPSSASSDAIAPVSCSSSKRYVSRRVP